MTSAYKLSHIFLHVLSCKTIRQFSICLTKAFAPTRARAVMAKGQNVGNADLRHMKFAIAKEHAFCSFPKLGATWLLNFFSLKDVKTSAHVGARQLLGRSMCNTKGKLLNFRDPPR